MNFVIANSMEGVFQTMLQGFRMIGTNTIAAGAVIAVGLICAVLGFRLTRIVCALFGAAVGAGLCGFVATSYLPVSIGMIGTAVAAVIGALLVGYLFFHLSYIMIFVICAAVGGVLGSIPAMAAGLMNGASQNSTIVFFAVVIACAALFGAAGVLFFKPVVIILTAFGGAALAAPQIMWLLGIHGILLTGLATVGIGVVGALIQFLTCRNKKAPGFGRKKEKNADAAEADAEGLAYQEVEEIIEPPYMAADALNEQFRKNWFMRFLMFVSPLFAVLGAAAIIYIQSKHIELVMFFMFLCFAGKKYKTLILTNAMMLGYSAFRLVITFDISTPGKMVATGLNAAACGMFFILLIIAARMSSRAKPKKTVRRVPVDEVDEISDETDILESTRPLDGEEVDNIMQTMPVADEEAASFAPGVPEDFRQTQEEIFEAAEDYRDEMPAEPDAEDAFLADIDKAMSATDETKVL